MVKWIYRRFIWIQGIHAICWISGSISFTIEILVFQNEIHTYFCQKLDTFKLWHVRICSSRFLWDFLLVNFLFYTARFRFSSSDLLKKNEDCFSGSFSFWKSRSKICSFWCWTISGVELWKCFFFFEIYIDNYCSLKEGWRW